MVELGGYAEWVLDHEFVRICTNTEVLLRWEFFTWILRILFRGYHLGWEGWLRWTEVLFLMIRRNKG